MLMNDRHNGSAFTPLGSRGRHRSRVAGALRANNELEQLSSIDEEQNHALPAPPPPPAPAVDLTRPRETQYYASKSQPKPQGRYAPSMPPMRARPIVSWYLLHDCIRLNGSLILLL